MRDDKYFTTSVSVVIKTTDPVLAGIVILIVADDVCYVYY